MATRKKRGKKRGKKTSSGTKAKLAAVIKSLNSIKKHC